MKLAGRGDSIPGDSKTPKRHSVWFDPNLVDEHAPASQLACDFRSVLVFVRRYLDGSTAETLYLFKTGFGLQQLGTEESLRCVGTNLVDEHTPAIRRLAIFRLCSCHARCYL